MQKTKKQIIPQRNSIFNGNQPITGDKVLKNKRKKKKRTNRCMISGKPGKKKKGEKNLNNEKIVKKKLQCHYVKLTNTYSFQRKIDSMQNIKTHEYLLFPT